jgi:hypothetical protein
MQKFKPFFLKLKINFRKLKLLADKNISIFARSKGGLAQLARAFDWQSKGQGFDSPNLHQNKELQ